MTNPQVNIRLSEDLVNQIQKLIDMGEFGNLSEFVRYSIRVTLRDYPKRGPPT